MNRLPVTFLLAAGLVACASQQRTEPPAPVVSATTGAAEPAPPKPPASPPPQESVEVYAYRPPSSAPDAVVPSGTGATESALPADGGPVSERATPIAPGPAPEPGASVAPAGTSTELRTPAPAPAPKPAPQVVAYAPPLPTPSLQPASDALIKQAEQQRQARDYVGAAATLERALGIQPQEPYVWNRLARVRMEQGLYAQAGNLASRSNDLAGNQSALKQDNWGIIAAARRAAGDTAGAVEAEKKAHGG